MNATFKEQLVQGCFHDASHLTIRWQDGRESRFDSMWLRDNCPEDRDLHSGQRYLDISDLRPDPRISGVKHVGNGVLEFAWAGELKYSRIHLQWLRGHAHFQNSDPQEQPKSVIWTGNCASQLLCKDYAEVASSDRARWQWLRAIAEYGIVFLQNVPRKDQQVEEIAQFVGLIHETNYGRIFDVRSEPNPNNLANTDRGLSLHTDNPYRDPVPGFQILHCLQASPEGGDSFFADGFAVADHLRAQHPVSFLLLATTPVRFTFQDARTHLSAERPMLQLNFRGEVAAVHYNNRSIAPLSLPPDRMRPFYLAYRELAQILRSPDFKFRIKLQSGDAVAFDNHRVLHGRAGFNAALHPRHLQGCYINRDSLFSNLRVLHRKFREALP